MSESIDSDAVENSGGTTPVSLARVLVSRMDRRREGASVIFNCVDVFSPPKC